MSRLSGPLYLLRRLAQVVRWKCLPRSRETSAMRQETTAQLGKSPVEADGSVAGHRALQATRLPLQRRGAWAFTLQKQPERVSAPRRAVVPRMRGEGGFTLAELLVTVGVLVLLVFFATQLLKSAATVSTLG